MAPQAADPNLKNGGLDMDLREQLLARGRDLEWHPSAMRVRYETGSTN